MKLRAKVLLAALVVAACSGAAAQAVVTRMFTSDNFSYASYFLYSVDGCEAMAVEVFATKSMTRTNSTKVFFPIVRAQVSAYSYCTGVFAFMSGADESPSLFTNRDLTLSTASARMELMDEFGNLHPMTVNLTWSDGALALDKDRNRVVFTSPRSRTMIMTTGSVRYSETVTGSLILDGLDLLGPNNPTQAFGSGYVTSSKGSTIDIIRY